MYLKNKTEKELFLENSEIFKTLFLFSYFGILLVNTRLNYKCTELNKYISEDVLFLCNQTESYCSFTLTTFPDQDTVRFLLRHKYQKLLNITYFVRTSHMSQPERRLCRDKRHSVPHKYSSRSTSALSIHLQEQVGQIHGGNISECSVS